MTRPVGSLATALLLLLATALPAGAADRDGDGLRDAFERRYGVTQPGRADSDRDGVVDPAEDIDGDGLGNLGEQRFGTDPGLADSDADGTADGAEDADRDGTSNARQQDRRPVPSDLTPSLERAAWDYQPRRKACMTWQRESVLRPCTFGDTDSRTTVVIFGDSHAAHWIPALDQAGRRAGWRIVQLTKASCPSAFLLTMTQQKADGGRTCRTWRERAIAWIRERRPELVILSNLGRYDIVRTDGSLIRTRDEQERRWRLGLVDMLERLPAASTGLVLADTPNMLRDVPACLQQHRRDMSACVVGRQKAVDRRHARTEEAAAETTGDRYATVADKICSYDPCPLVQGNVMMWRDIGHLTATFSRKLAPSIREVIEAALVEPAREPESSWPG
jgi:hypothetical protein